MRSPLTVFQIFAFVSNYIHLKDFAWKREHPKNYKLQVLLESTCKVVLGTYNLAAQMRSVFLLRAVEF